MSDDEEKRQEQFEPVGFAGVADFIASDKEHSTSIYRQFQKIAARNILYLQSELRELELRQEEFDRDDAAGDLDAIQAAVDWQEFCDRARDPNDERAKERMQLVKEIREKVKEYQKTVLRNAQMLQLQRPSKQVHEAFLGHFGNRHKSRPYPRLAGLSADLYDDEFRDDLMALHGRPDEDRLTTYLRNRFPGLFARRSRSTNSPVGYLSEYRLKLVVGSINVILAAAMLFGSIYNLYFVNNEQKRLGLTAGYTVAFALCIGLLTNARRSEVFGACAAYAAVLVVFVSGNLGNKS